MKKILMVAGIALLSLILLIFFTGFIPAEIEAALPSTIKDRDGNTVVNLDRELRREEIDIEQVPEHVQQAFIAIEDARFYDHFGVDFRAIFRAAISNFFETGNPLEGSQGGSTITQQLVKNTILTPERTLTRKVQEAWLAFRLERSYSKEEILEL